MRRAPAGEGCRPYLCQVDCTTTDAPISTPDQLPASDRPCWWNRAFAAPFVAVDAGCLLLLDVPRHLINTAVAMLRLTSPSFGGVASDLAVPDSLSSPGWRIQGDKTCECYTSRGRR
ncbi:hypothetical protein GW17_00050122 [Ensete ventricosum]|nr:hypothetical protein GW17_00050122 [Ensete ventricosum]